MTNRPLIARCRDDGGAVAIIGALSMTAILAMAAMVADLGSIYVAKRDLQAATDAAALSATYPIAQGGNGSPLTFAQTYLAKNMPSASIVTATPGIYCPDSSLPSASRFQAGGTACLNEASITGLNAVKVTSSVVSPLYFGRAVIPGQTSKTLSTTATAAQINEAGFYVGSGVASVTAMNNAILDALLPGSTINLASYNGILSANVSALSFLNALATNLNITAGTYGSVLQSSVTVQQVLQAEIDALNAPGSLASTQLSQLKTSISGSPSLKLSGLLDLGVWQGVAVGSTNPATALNASLNAYQLASLSAQVANGSSFVAIPTTTPLGIPGVATLTAATTVIQPPQGPAFVFSPVGVTVHTAQVRLQLNLQLLNALSVVNPLGVSLGTAPVNLPIYVEVASGQATLTKITCGYNPATDATIQIGAQSGLADAYVGNVSQAVMSNITNPVTVTPATLVNLAGIVTVTGSSHVSVGSGTSTPLTFTQANMSSATAQTVTSTGMTSNLLQTLGSSLTLSGSLLGISLAPASPTLKSVTTLLTPVFAGLDPLVDSMLAGLGIKIGYMDVTATGVRCGVPTLVN